MSERGEPHRYLLHERGGETEQDEGCKAGRGSIDLLLGEVKRDVSRLSAYEDVDGEDETRHEMKILALEDGLSFATCPKDRMREIFGPG